MDNGKDFQTTFESKFKKFCTTLFSHLKEKAIDVSNLHMDHVCYRVESVETYNSFKEKLSLIGDLLIESPVGGRLISTFRLFRPFSYEGRLIKLIELPQPKENNKHQEGFEHAEFVINENFESFSKRYPLEFDWSGAIKTHNPELKLKLDHNLSVKFHHMALDEVIERELSED